MCPFNSKLNLIIAGTCILYLFSGCAKAPDTELAAAKAALKAALDVEADKYMSKNFQNVQKALESAETEIAVQNTSFFLTRNYKRAIQLLNNATTLATEIKNEAPRVKEETVAQVKENLVSAKKMLKETAGDIKKAKRSREKKVIDEMNTYLNSADSAVIKATAEFDAGNVLGASEKLGNVERLIKKITDKLSTSTEELM